MKNCPTKVAVAFSLLAVSMAAALNAVPGSLERPDHACGAGCNHHGRPQHGMQCADLPAGLPMSMCFTEDADPEFVADVTQRLINVWLNGGMDGGLAYQLAPRWNLNGSSAQGQPLQIRWSVVPDGVTIPDEIGLGIGSAPNNVNATLAARFGSLENGKNLIRQVFQRWSDLTGLSYVEVTDDGAAWGSAGGATRGDVRIAGRGLTNTSILAYNQFPNNGDMVLNSDAGWGPTANNYRYFRNIVAHEHGHGIGLEHVCPASTTKLMEPFIFTNVDGPQVDDIRGAQRQYGDNLEAASDALANAAIPTNATGSSSYLSLSIDDNSDIDLWKITATAGMKVSMIVNPSGGTYSAGPQTSSCDTGTSIAASSIHDLKIDVLDSAAAVLFTQNANAVGLGETLSNYVFASAGTFYVRVAPVTTTNGLQLYNATLTITPPPSNPADIDGDGVVNAADLGVLLAAWGSSLDIADINDDGIVDGNDLGLVLSSWTL
jgi:hypothetical protein